MNAMKNIKKPAYAVELGQGIFAAGPFNHLYECSTCHYQTTAALGTPKCPMCNRLMTRIS